MQVEGYLFQHVFDVAMYQVRSMTQSCIQVAQKCVGALNISKIFRKETKLELKVYLFFMHVFYSRRKKVLITYPGNMILEE